jgi:hypothetical protein
MNDLGPVRKALNQDVGAQSPYLQLQILIECQLQLLPLLNGQLEGLCLLAGARRQSTRLHPDMSECMHQGYRASRYMCMW